MKSFLVDGVPGLLEGASGRLGGFFACGLKDDPPSWS